MRPSVQANTLLGSWTCLDFHLVQFVGRNVVIDSERRSVSDGGTVAAAADRLQRPSKCFSVSGCFLLSRLYVWTYCSRVLWKSIRNVDLQLVWLDKRDVWDVSAAEIVVELSDEGIVVGFSMLIELSLGSVHLEDHVSVFWGSFGWDRFRCVLL